MRDQAATDAIEVEQLVKRYRGARTNAVDGASFSVGRGETFGLLGPNGAGKTTTIGILTTMVLPTAERAVVAGGSTWRPRLWPSSSASGSCPRGPTSTGASG